MSKSKYTANPSCATFVPGARGNCAIGSCGGAIAAGACGEVDNSTGAAAGEDCARCRCGGNGGGCGGNRINHLALSVQ